MPEIFGHRGCAGLEVENSLAALTRAKQLGVGVEIDVRLTLDGIPVLMHDSDLKRMTGVRAKVCELNLKDLRKHRLKDNSAIPTLEEALTLLKDSPHRTNIELKDDCVDEVCRIASMHGMEKKIVISSFDQRIVSKVDGFEKALITANPLGLRKSLGTCGSRRIHINHLLATERMIRSLKGYKIAVWTVNSPRRIRKFTEMGLDIITDYPDRAKGI